MKVSNLLKVVTAALAAAALSACAPQPIDASEAYEAQMAKMQSDIDSLDERLLARSQMDQLLEHAEKLAEQNAALIERIDALEEAAAVPEISVDSLPAGERVLALVYAYDAENGAMTYDRLEVIDEDDAARKSEYHDRGVYVAFNEGYAVRNDFEIMATSPVYSGAIIEVELPAAQSADETADTPEPVYALLSFEGDVIVEVMELTRAE